jgi:hypothetical protein
MLMNMCHYWQPPLHYFGSPKLYRTIRRGEYAAGTVMERRRTE